MLNQKILKILFVIMNSCCGAIVLSFIFFMLCFFQEREARLKPIDLPLPAALAS